MSILTKTLEGIMKVIKKILSFLILPIFKLFRKIFWDLLLKKLFLKLKLNNTIDFIEDYLNAIEKGIKEPSKILNFTKRSYFIILIPFIMNFISFPIQKILKQRKRDKLIKEQYEYYQQLAKTDPELYQQIYSQQQYGGGILSILKSEPIFLDYILLYIVIYILYFYDKKEKCEIENKEKEGNKYNTLNLLKYGSLLSLNIIFFYFFIHKIIPYIPFIGFFYSIIMSIPIISIIVPGYMTYIYYNIFRNIIDLMDNRTKCLNE